MEEEYDEIFEQLTGECELKFNRAKVVIQKCSKNQLSSKISEISQKYTSNGVGFLVKLLLVMYPKAGAFI